MKTARSALLLALGLATLGCDFLTYGPGETSEAETRVNAVLAGMQKAGDTTNLDLQEAVCRWYNGRRILNDAMEMEAALDGFDRWRLERKVANRRIASYELVAAEVVPDTNPPAVLVTVTIEGKTHQILVPDKQAMSWHGKPPR